MRSIRVWACAAVLVMAASGLIACAAGKGETSAEVVARVGDVEITLDELDRETMRQNIQPYQALYDARSAALEKLIESRLLEKEAKARGIGADELVASEITAKISPVRDADISTFFDQNQNRMGGRSLEQMTPAIRSFIETGNATRAREAFVSQLRAKSNVRVVLDPPRAEVIVAGNDPFKGPAGARVTIVEYSDFQ